LTGSSIEQKSLLRLYESFTFSGFKRCLWKRNNNENSSNSNVSINVEDSDYWYINNGHCTITAKQKNELSLPSAAKEHTTKLVQVANCSKEYDHPVSAYSRNTFSNEETILEGTVNKLNPLGWIEVTVSSPVLLHPIVNIFVVHHRRSDVFGSLHKGTAIRVSFVFPVYLWGKLSGFAATVRSYIEIVDSHSHSSDTIGRNKPRLRIPPDIKSGCHLYAAWRAYAQRKYHKSVLNSNVNVPSGLIKFLEHCGSSSDFSISLSDVTRLPSNRSVQEEFAIPNYAELYSVRAGCDADWLSSFFPKIFNCSDLLKIKSRLMKVRVRVRVKVRSLFLYLISHFLAQTLTLILTLKDCDGLPSSSSHKSKSVNSIEGSEWSVHVFELYETHNSLYHNDLGKMVMITKKIIRLQCFC
jgi:hypothetical protein